MDFAGLSAGAREVCFERLRKARAREMRGAGRAACWLALASLLSSSSSFQVSSGFLSPFHREDRHARLHRRTTSSVSMMLLLLNPKPFSSARLASSSHLPLGNTTFFCRERECWCSCRFSKKAPPGCATSTDTAPRSSRLGLREDQSPKKRPLEPIFLGTLLKA